MDSASLVFRMQQSAARLLDRRYYLHTAATVGRDELGHRDGERSNEPSRWLTLTVALPRGWVTCDDVFADIGCGEGEIVVRAARYPFKRVIGVERFGQPAAIARANLTKATHVRAKETEIFTADAATWQPQDDLTIVCLCNSVQGELFRAMLRQLKRLVDRRGQPLRIIYINPVEHQILLGDPQVSELTSPPDFLVRLTCHPSRYIRRYLLSPREQSRQTLRAIPGFTSGAEPDHR
jgi:SAM-dependent methyltransferase